MQVSYRSDSSVEEGLDYVKGPDVVTFESGQRNQTIVMQLLPDDKPELEEVLIVRLVRYEYDLFILFMTYLSDIL